jgi:transposase
MDLRELKALELAARARITYSNGYWSVPSQTSAATIYRVTIGAEQSCECEDFLLRREACKHVLAAKFVSERAKGSVEIELDIDKVPKKPTYQQADWSVYKMAQRSEKPRFLELLADLVGGIEEPPHPGKGRKPVPIRDRIVACCYKVWSTQSALRFDGDLQQAIADGYISRPMHPNMIHIFMEMEELAPYLKAMIARSSLPLAAIETEFAVDSSGFTTSKFHRWYDHKYGVERQAHDWIKVHIACGVNTHCITAAAIYGRDAGDCPIMPELVKGTAANFTLDAFSADKAYLSLDNVDEVFKAGGIPFIAPKSSTTGAIGGKFEEMYHYYLYKREQFLKNYHKRSNIESCFSAVKRKYGDHIRAKTPSAGTNEVLCKLLCQNIWAVILSQAELGIEAEFWKKEEAEQPEGGPAILRFARPV